MGDYLKEAYEKNMQLDESREMIKARKKRVCPHYKKLYKKAKLENQYYVDRYNEIKQKILYARCLYIGFFVLALLIWIF